MSLEQILTQADQEITSGEFDLARDRLHGLLNSHPNNLDIRHKLGKVYWHLGQAEKAGRYWFLIEADTPEMVAACYEFAAACENDPQEILRRLEFKGDIMELDSGFGQFMLLNLKREAQERYGADIDIERNQEELDNLMEPLVFEKQSLARQTLNWAGCLTAMFLPLALITWGTVALIRWLL
ncbi:MAG: DUF6584 family protein [Anaerolineae bacterium]